MESEHPSSNTLHLIHVLHVCQVKTSLLCSGFLQAHLPDRAWLPTRNADVTVTSTPTRGVTASQRALPRFEAPRRSALNGRHVRALLRSPPIRPIYHLIHLPILSLSLSLSLSPSERSDRTTTGRVIEYVRRKRLLYYTWHSTERNILLLDWSRCAGAMYYYY